MTEFSVKKGRRLYSRTLKNRRIDGLPRKRVKYTKNMVMGGTLLMKKTRTRENDAVFFMLLGLTAVFSAGAAGTALPRRTKRFIRQLPTG